MEHIDGLKDDWVYRAFHTLREQVIVVTQGFGRKLREQLQLIKDAEEMRPPTMGSVMLSVALESTNIVSGLVTGDDEAPADPDGEGPADGTDPELPPEEQ